MRHLRHGWLAIARRGRGRPGLVVTCGLAGALLMALGASAAPAKEGVFPGRNGRIALQELTLVGEQLVERTVTLNTDGSGYRALRPKTARPRWSPDGKRLVFWAGLVFGDIPNSIRIMNANGSGHRIVFGKAAQIRMDLSVGYPNWLPGGDIVFLGNKGSRTGIYRIHPDGTGMHRILRLADVAREHGGPTVRLLTVSPNGRRFAFIRNNGDYEFAVWVMKSNGSGLTKLARGCIGGGGVTLDWSPNGKQLLGAWEEKLPTPGCGNDSGMFLMSPRGGTPKRIYTERQEPGSVPGHCAPVAAFSPNGKQIVFAVQRLDANSALCDTVMLMPASGGEPHVIRKVREGCNPCRGYAQPAWQPLPR
jgi:WD40-like Beta Propeller Repeat